MTNITLSYNETHKRDYAHAKLKHIGLTAYRLANDVNGNPLYRVHVSGLADIPKLFLPIRTNYKKNHYTMQSHEGLEKMLKKFIEYHGEQLENLSEWSVN